MSNRNRKPQTGHQVYSFLEQDMLNGVRAAERSLNKPKGSIALCDYASTVLSEQGHDAYLGGVIDLSLSSKFKDRQKTALFFNSLETAKIIADSKCKVRDSRFIEWPDDLVLMCPPAGFPLGPALFYKTNDMRDVYEGAIELGLLPDDWFRTAGLQDKEKPGLYILARPPGKPRRAKVEGRKVLRPPHHCLYNPETVVQNFYDPKLRLAQYRELDFAIAYNDESTESRDFTFQMYLNFFLKTLLFHQTFPDLVTSELPDKFVSQADGNRNDYRGLGMDFVVDRKASAHFRSPSIHQMWHDRWYQGQYSDMERGTRFIAKRGSLVGIKHAKKKTSVQSSEKEKSYFAKPEERFNHLAAPTYKKSAPAPRRPSATDESDSLLHKILGRLKRAS